MLKSYMLPILIAHVNQTKLQDTSEAKGYG